MTSYKQVQRVLFLTLFLNLLVAAAKLFWGRWTGSLSMQADGFHSFFDGASNIVGLVGIWAASHPPDDSHPYGHKKFETFAAFGISVFLFLTCFRILENSYTRLQAGAAPEATILSFLIMLGTMGINLFVAWWETKKGRELKSDILVADAMHTKSDFFASLSVLISLIATRLGYTVLDPAAAVVIAALIGKIGFEILAETSRVLSDASRLDAGQIKEIVMRMNAVEECHGIRTRGSQSHVYLDFHIHVPPDMTAEKSHILVHQIEERIKQELPIIADVVIHVEPHIPELEND